MKQIFQKIIGWLVVLFLLGIAASYLWTSEDEEGSSVRPPTTEESAPGDSSEEEAPPDDELGKVKICKITYVMLEEDEAKAVYDFLWSESGTYPTTFVEDTPLYVSDLKGRVSRQDYGGWGTIETGWVVDPNDGNKEYEFKGWYLNRACTIPYEEGARYVEDLTLYADINVAYWIGPF